MPLSGWPAVVDDDGTKTSGTRFNAALTNAIKASIEASIFSGTNPSISPANIIDEVKNARGSLATLDARLDVALNEDGTPKTQAGQATNADLQAQLQSRNLVINGAQDDWLAGASAAPDNFTLTGAGATIARTGAGEADTFTFGAGKYAAKITRAGADVDLYQDLIAAADMAGATKMRGKKIGVGIWAKSSIANHVRLVVDDGVSTTATSYHTGGGSEEFLSTTHTLDSGATRIRVAVEVNNTNGAAYVGGWIAVFSNLAPTQWQALDQTHDASLTRRGLVNITDQEIQGIKKFNKQPVFQHGTSGTYNGTVGGLIHVNVTEVGNVGGGTDDLMTHSLAANSLDANLKVIRVTAYGRFAANANNKSLNAVFGASSLALLTGSAQNNTRWKAEFIIVRTGAATQKAWAYLEITTGGSGTAESFAVASPAETLTGAVTIKFTAAGTADNDVVQELMIIEALG